MFRSYKYNNRRVFNISSQSLSTEIYTGGNVAYNFKIVDSSNSGNVFNFYVDDVYKKVLLNINSEDVVNVYDEAFNNSGIYRRKIKVQNTEGKFSNELEFKIVVKEKDVITLDLPKPDDSDWNLPLSSKLIGANRSVWGTDVNDICDRVRNLKLNSFTLSCKFNISSLTGNDVVVDKNDINLCKKILTNLASDGTLRKINLIFEPYPYINDGDDVETEFKPSNPTLFLKNWKSAILNTIPKFLEYNFFGVYVNSNMDSLIDYIDEWKDIYDSVKNIVPKSNVMVRTNFWTIAVWSQSHIDAFKNKINNKYFGIFDILAVAAYFELADVADATSDQIYGWIVNGTAIYDRQQKIRDEVREFAKVWNKKIFFGELGCASYRYAVREPWNVNPSSTIDEDTQANLFKGYYRAFISDLKDEDWFLGFSIYSTGDGGHYDVYGKKAGNYIRSLDAINNFE